MAGWLFWRGDRTLARGFAILAGQREGFHRRRKVASRRHGNLRASPIRRVDRGGCGLPFPHAGRDTGLRQCEPRLELNSRCLLRRGRQIGRWLRRHAAWLSWCRGGRGFAIPRGHRADFLRHGKIRSRGERSQGGLQGDRRDGSPRRRQLRIPIRFGFGLHRTRPGRLGSRRLRMLRCVRSSEQCLDASRRLQTRCRCAFRRAGANLAFDRAACAHQARQQSRKLPGGGRACGARRSFRRESRCGSRR